MTPEEIVSVVLSRVVRSTEDADEMPGRKVKAAVLGTLRDAIFDVLPEDVTPLTLFRLFLERAGLTRSDAFYPHDLEAKEYIEARDRSDGETDFYLSGSGLYGAYSMWTFHEDGTLKEFGCWE